MIINVFIVYMAIINSISFIAFGVDKRKAQKKRWRIPETTLLLLATAGGSIGAWIGMKVCHHKTQHKKFTYGIPLILLLQIIAFYFFTK